MENTTEISSRELQRRHWAEVTLFQPFIFNMAEQEQQNQVPQGFNLNEWKNQYQNNKNRPAVAFEWLWKNYDAENWYEIECEWQTPGGGSWPFCFLLYIFVMYLNLTTLLWVQLWDFMSPFGKFRSKFHKLFLRTFWNFTYKYNDEIAQDFLACNSIKGTVQRWEPVRIFWPSIFGS